MGNTENKSTIELLSDFAVQTNRKIYSTEVLYPSTAVHRITLHKRTVFIPDTDEELSFLVGYHDPRSFSENELFFGVFFKTSLPSTLSFDIRKKDILDKLNPFLAKKIFKTGSNQFDSSAVITGNDNIKTNQVLNDRVLQNLILELLEVRECLNIGLNEVNLNFVPNFVGSSNFGVFTKQAWFVDHEIIQNLFVQIRQLEKLINKE